MKNDENESEGRLSVDVKVYQFLTCNAGWWNAAGLARSLGLRKASVWRALQRLEGGGLLSGKAMSCHNSGQWVRHYKLKS